MRESIPLLIIGLLFGAMGWWVGYNEGKKIPCADIVLEEIQELQKDVMQCQSANLVMLVRIVYLEEWRASILYRPPEISEQDKKLIRKSIETQKKELERNAKIQ